MTTIDEKPRIHTLDVAVFKESKDEKIVRGWVRNVGDEWQEFIQPDNLWHNVELVHTNQGDVVYNEILVDGLYFDWWHTDNFLSGDDLVLEFYKLIGVV